ncbi:hypothetical protein Ae201684P_010613 [Aphanomyces euteiches]|uniref:Cupin type-2 domain-containing protein n=1 Tax=Aphanomyces euteiches TaxID=100861 RepID=A0A6G0WPN2_9STRA|nr:hypothetical protein Ae201684_013060 [Aphanomyces euteiches]KAH9076676.1 hypothetical protein Ae201684P_010613 [Aphanomyces euteiches]
MKNRSNLKSSSTCEAPLHLGKADGCPRTIYPLINECGFDMGVETVPSQSRVPMHVHQDKDEVITILRGTATMHLNVVETTAKCGDMVLIRRGEAHEIRNESPDELFFAWGFTPSQISFAESMQPLASS